MKNYNYVDEAEFLKRAKAKYNNKFEFDLLNYAGYTKNKIGIKCPIHGWFKQIPDIFLLKKCLTGCKLCGLASKNKSKTKSYQDFLNEAELIYEGKYEYPVCCSNFKNRKSRISIKCHKHGFFEKSAQKHLSGQGCWECKVQELIDKKVLIGNYSEIRFKRHPELINRPACLYYLSINNGEFYKIGITIDLKGRLRSLKCKSKSFVKNIKLIWKHEDTLYNCFKKEQEILLKYGEFRQRNKWSTEFFNKNVIPSKKDFQIKKNNSKIKISIKK